MRRRKVKMRAYERLLNYVKVYTTSEDEQENVPSTSRQFDLGNQLAEELKKIGVQDVRIDDKCYVYGVIPATEGLEEKPAIGFIAHMDTAPDFSGENVNPQIIPEYDGGDVKLGDSEYALTLKDFPHLASLKGRTLITTDGSTLLGADDKAGVAEIMTMAEQVITENIPHGKICIGFTPDEEVGRGADFFDVEDFGADFAYTVDGGAENEIEYENFNAAGAKVKIKGFSVHPGSSKNTMINAALVAMEFNNMLPAGDTPANTEEYEGFFHLCEMSGDVSSASLDYIIRDHDRTRFEERKKEMERLVAKINEEYGPGTATLELRDQYYNMREQIEPVMHIIDTAFAAMKAVGVEPRVKAIRGGTDGAQLSFKGLPCPNIFAGGLNFHGRYEFVPIQNMEKAMNVIVKIAELVASK